MQSRQKAVSRVQVDSSGVVPPSTSLRPSNNGHHSWYYTSLALQLYIKGLYVHSSDKTYTMSFNDLERGQSSQPLVRGAGQGKFPLQMRH